LQALKASKALNTQFIVDYVDTVKLCERTAIVMPYYKLTLYEICNRAISEKLTLFWFAFILKGLSAAHSQKKDGPI
jgi:serine/threonine protein kinase